MNFIEISNFFDKLRSACPNAHVSISLLSGGSFLVRWDWRIKTKSKEYEIASYEITFNVFELNYVKLDAIIEYIKGEIRQHTEQVRQHESL